MISREAVVLEARSFLDTPFHHQGRLKGVGVDCIGIPICLGHTFRFSDFDTTDYGEQPDPERMGELLHEHLDEISFSDLLPADLVWFRVAIDPQHVAIITEVEPRLMMIHALRRPVSRRNREDNKVVETGLDKVWRDRIVGCFRFRGVG